MKTTISVGILAIGLAFSGVAQAVVVASTTLNVSATVAVVCAITTTPVNFGNLNATQFSTASGDVSVTCTSGTPYTITLDAGLNSLILSQRHMTDALGNLAYYTLTSDVGLINPWGDASPVGASVADTSNGAVQPHTVYGKAKAINGVTGVVSPAGSYSDTVSVTVNY